MAGDLAGVPFDILHGLGDEIGDMRGRFKEGSYYSAGLERQAAMREQLEAQRAELATSVGQTSQEQGSPRTRKALGAFGGLTGGILDDPAARFEPITKSDIAQEYQGEYADMNEIQKRLLAASSVEDVMPILLDDKLYSKAAGTALVGRTGDVISPAEHRPTKPTYSADPTVRLLQMRKEGMFGAEDEDGNLIDPEMQGHWDAAIKRAQHVSPGLGGAASELVKAWALTGGDESVDAVKEWREKMNEAASYRDDLSRASDLLDPEMLTYYGKGKAMVLNEYEKMGGKLEPGGAAEKFVGDSYVVKQRLERVLTAILKAMAGTAVAEHEAKRITNTLPNLELGTTGFKRTMTETLAVIGIGYMKWEIWKSQGSPAEIAPWQIHDSYVDAALKSSYNKFKADGASGEQAILLTEEKYGLSKGMFGHVYQTLNTRRKADEAVSEDVSQ